jgi:hypothetical protein
VRSPGPLLIANAPGDELSVQRADNHRAEIKSGKVTYRIVLLVAATDLNVSLIAPGRGHDFTGAVWQRPRTARDSDPRWATTREPRG